jgi:multicomponent Na+:H+ antiporter subunit G
MSFALDVVATVLLALGAFVGLTGALGVLRMPDFYSRLHPAGKNDSLAQVFIMLGLVSHMVGLYFRTDPPDYFSIAGVIPRLIMIGLFIFLTSPIAGHAITRAAHLDGLKIWEAEKERRD